MTRVLGAVKSKVKIVHRWIGVFSLAVFALAALSGAVIQWDTESVKLFADREIWRSGAHCVRCPLGDAAQRLAARFSGERLTIDVEAPEFSHTKISASATRTGETEADTTRRFVIEPVSLEIREVTDHPAGLAERAMAWTYDLHESLLLGSSGRVIMWGAALLLFVMPLTGVLLWWPMTRLRRSSFVITKGLRGRTWHYDRHRVIGFYTVLPLVIIAATGFLLALFHFFPRPQAALTAPDDRAFTVARLMLRPGATPGAVQDYAQRLFPNLRPIRLQFDGVSQRVQVSMAGPDGLRPTRVMVDARAGLPLAIQKPEQGFVPWLASTARVLHNGEILGLGGRLLNVVVAGAIVFVTWSGFEHWRVRRAARSRAIEKNMAK